MPLPLDYAGVSKLRILACVTLAQPAGAAAAGHYHDWLTPIS